MSKFAIKPIEAIVGKIKFFKLVKDEVCQYDDFCKEIEKNSNLKSQLVTIHSRMDDVANIRRLPKTKFRDITPAKEKNKEYEIKTSDLRVYLIKDDVGNIVFIGGKKNSQPEDIKKFRSLKKAYLNKNDNDKGKTAK